MKLKTNIEYINNILGEIPEFLYHGRRGEHIPNNEYEIVVYNNEKEIKGKRFWEYKGRTHLDFAFHGFYLTPCEALARKWAFSDIPKDKENYQVLKFKINHDALEDLNKKVLVVPDSRWAEYIYNCRAKIVKENNFDFVYGFVADGIMSEIYPKIEEGYYAHNPEHFHNDILKEVHKDFVKDYQSERKLYCLEIIESCGLNQYKNYQLCISSNKALKMIELIDIIEISSEEEIPDNINVDYHLKDYKKFVPDNLIQILKERGE